MKWIKKGHIFNSSGEFEWSKDYAQAPRPLILHDRIRIFYSTRYFDCKTLPISQASFIDVDRNNLANILYKHNEPSLSLGSKNSFSEYGIHSAMLIPQKECTYYFYQGWQRGNKYPYTTEVGLAKSYDNGLTFKKYGEAPIFGKSKLNPYYVNGVFIIQKNDKYIMFYSSGKEWLENNGKLESVYQIKTASSSDLINWDLNDEFIIKPKFENECQNTATVIYLNNKYHMWFCYRQALDFRNSDNGYRIGYAWSNDLETWNRDDSLAGIDISKDDSWDSQMICYPYVFEIDGKVIMLYCGNYFGKSGFGYAELDIK